MAEAQADRLVDQALSLIKKEDIIHKGFLKPIEVTLKTYKTELLDPHSGLQSNSLPNGLKIAVRSLFDSDVYLLHNIEPIEDNQTYEQIRERSQDNMLALMKEKEGIQLAICICMYNEDKKTLKKTLAAVEENIENMVALEGVDPDKIAVFVMIDGIEKMDRSAVDFFEEMDRSNNIYLGNNMAPSLSINELAQRSLKDGHTNYNEDQLRNVSNFIFDYAQLEQRNRLRFQAIYDQFMQKREMLADLGKLKKKKPYYNGLPGVVQDLFFDEAFHMRRRQFNETDEVLMKLKREQILEAVFRDQHKMKSCYANAIYRAEVDCKRFIDSRREMSYLSYYRKKIQFSKRHIKKSHYDANTSHEDLRDDRTRELPYTMMNLFMCVKYPNNGKLASHNWFFNGFCKELKPKYTVLLDVGLKPEGQAIMKMYHYLRKHKDTGGVCGYLNLVEERIQKQELKEEDIDCLTRVLTCFVDIKRTQQVDYHFSHLVDKPFQASFGYIQMLPSSFSAYNMKGVLRYDGEQTDEMLKAYFAPIEEKIEHHKHLSTGRSQNLIRTTLWGFITGLCMVVDPSTDESILYDENIYLAEDRILCMAIHKKGYDMAFLPDASATIDPIPTVHGLLGQRKRWINGSYFAFEKVKKELHRHERKAGFSLALNIQFLYLTLVNTLTYFAPALFMFAVHIAMEAFREDVLVKVLEGVVDDPEKSEFYNAFVYTMDFIYVILMSSVIVYTLHITKEHYRFTSYIYAVSTLLGIFMIAVLGVVGTDIIRGLFFSQTYLITNEEAVDQIPGGTTIVNVMRLLIVGLIACFLVPMLIYMLFYCKAKIFCDVALGSLSYIFYWPTYINILNIYSLCKIDELSWGVSGFNLGHLKDSWKLIKFIHVAQYIIWNIILATVLITLGAYYVPRFYTTLLFVLLLFLSIIFKVIIGILYLIFYRCIHNNIISHTPVINTESTLGLKFDRYERQIMRQIRNHLLEIKQEYISNEYIGTFIQAARTNKNISAAAQRQKHMIARKSSSMERHSSRQFMSKGSQQFSSKLRHQTSAKPPFEPSKGSGNLNDHKRPLQSKKEQPKKPFIFPFIVAENEPQVNRSDKEVIGSDTRLQGDLTAREVNNSRDQSSGRGLAKEGKGQNPERQQPKAPSSSKQVTFGTPHPQSKEGGKSSYPKNY